MIRLSLVFGIGNGYILDKRFWVSDLGVCAVDTLVVSPGVKATAANPHGRTAGKDQTTH